MNKKVLTFIVITIVASMLFGSGFYAGAATTKGAGSQNDPVVSLSYLEYRLEKLEQTVGQSDGNGNAAASGKSPARKVRIERGERFLPGEGSVIILYSGACTAVGNLIDTTEAEALQEGMPIGPYCQILVPEGSSGVVASESTVLFVMD
ncbi:MAG: hypothetical protein IKP88_12995 [Lachnospiraceae bacterium]|nr:hypothetical protein [Lachnospiraceae bacterium]